jgi:hypothetical protein
MIKEGLMEMKRMGGKWEWGELRVGRGVGGWVERVKMRKRGDRVVLAAILVSVLCQGGGGGGGGGGGYGQPGLQ